MRSVVDVAGRLLAEGEVLPHHDLHDVQVLDQQLVHVALRGELHEIGRERHHQKDVDAQLFDQFGAPGQRRQLRGMAAGVDDFHRMRVERHQHGGHVAGAAAFTACAISSAWPRCTPSNTPMVSTHLPQSVGISSWPRHRCTPASLRRSVVRREIQRG